jgi:hypothetical protein
MEPIFRIRRDERQMLEAGFKFGQVSAVCLDQGVLQTGRQGPIQHPVEHGADAATHFDDGKRSPPVGLPQMAAEFSPHRLTEGAVIDLSFCRQITDVAL